MQTQPGLGRGRVLTLAIEQLGDLRPKTMPGGKVSNELPETPSEQ